MNVAKRIYLDNAATTHLDADVFEIMTPYFIETFGNANSQHFFGRQAETAVVQARTKLAEIINAKPNEIYFTSGGTEADNWAVKGVAYSAGGRGRHIITSAVEHHAVYDTCKSLEKGGFEITYIPVDDEGIIDLAALENAVRDDTILVSIMYANNEIGTIMPIKRAVETVKKRNRRTVFHTDCVQAAGALPLDVAELGVDLMSVSAHKFYGPKGTGFLYIKNGVKIDRLMTGGNQERKMRGGTLNVPHIVGCAAALEKATRDRERNNAHIKSLRDYFIDRVSSEIADVYLNGSREHRLPGNANFSFEFIEGESLL
ncbi:MAG: cysteine desulfurase, partial [Clostridiales bacterium]|nr:cysteine desulfurase [Clostridiales bacterium]